MFEDELFYECSLCGLVHFDHFMATNCCRDYKNSSPDRDDCLSPTFTASYGNSDSSSCSGGDSGGSDCGGGCD